MADGLLVTPGSGATIATKDTGATGHAQIFKLSIDDATAALIPATAAQGLTVDVTRVQGNVTVVQPTAANLKVDASGVAVPVTDNSGSLTIDAPVATPVAVRLSDGATFISALPVTDNGGLLSVDDGGGSLTVDGTVAATQSGVWNIGTLTGITNTVTVDASGNAVPVTDNSGSLTVDAPVATPVAVRLSDGATFITALPVTDNGGLLSVDDGGGSLTVDGTVAATQSGTWDVGTLTTITNDVPIKDGGNVISVDDAGGSLTIDGTITADQGAAAALSAAWPTKISDGSNSADLTLVSAKYALQVDIVKSVGPVTQADKSSFVEGTGKVLPIAGVFNNSISGAPAEDQAAALRITARRGLHISIRKDDGTELGVSSDPVRTDPTGTTTQPVLDSNSAAALTALQLIDDGNLKQIAGNAVVEAANGIQKIGLSDEAGATYSETNALPVRATNLEKTPIRKVNTFSASQTDIAIWTPAGGKKFILEKILISATAAGVLRIFDNTNSAANTIALFTLVAGDQIIIPYPNGHPSSTADNVLRYTTGATVAGDLTALGYDSD